MCLSREHEFARGFVVGSVPVHELEGWKHVALDDEIKVTIHPWLPYTKVDVNDSRALLLGYIVDPYDIGASDQTVLLKVIKRLRQGQNIAEATREYGGRWAIVYKDNEKSIMFNDFAGQRSIYFTENIHAKLWASSHASLLARHVGFSPWEEGMEELTRSGAFAPENPYFWPHDTSPFLGIKRLVPNHYLTFNTRQAKRFYPTKRIERISLQTGIEQCADLLERLVVSASKKFRLAHGITAGLDSRTILAASRSIASGVMYYSEMRKGQNNFSPDVRIPKKLLSKLGFRHKVFDCRGDICPELWDVLKKNEFTPHEGAARVIQGLIDGGYPRDMVCINGNVSESARFSSSFRHPYDIGENVLTVNAFYLAKKAKMEKSRLAVREFSKWYAHIEGRARDCGIDVVDLFHAEQKMGGWLASLRRQFDLVQEVFSPYNCRLLIEKIWGVDRKYRNKPDYKLHMGMIKYLWPETLAFPINPPDRFNMYRLYLEGLFEPMAKAIFSTSALRKAKRKAADLIYQFQDKIGF